MFGGKRAKITPARPDGLMPWSPTVVENNRRMRRRGGRTLLLFLFMGGSLACLVVCGGLWIFSQRNQGGTPQAQAKQAGPSPTRPRPTLTATPQPTFTPLPAPTPTPTRKPFISASAELSLAAGAPGDVVALAVLASDDADVIVWFDNTLEVARVETADRQVTVSFVVPRLAPGRHLIMVDITNYDSNDRKVLPFDVR